MYRRAAFTLIESIIALTILTMVAGACFQLRAQSLSQTRSIAGRQADARLADTIFRMALAGGLGVAQRLGDEDDELRAMAWSGRREGREFYLVREQVIERNPVRASLSEDDAVRYPELVALYRYTLEFGDERYVMEWNR